MVLATTHPILNPSRINTIALRLHIHQTVSAASNTVFETASQVSGWDWLKRGLKKKGDAARESAVLWLCLTRLSVKVPCSFPLLT